MILCKVTYISPAAIPRKYKLIPIRNLKLKKAVELYFWFYFTLHFDMFQKVVDTFLCDINDYKN